MIVKKKRLIIEFNMNDDVNSWSKCRQKFCQFRDSSNIVTFVNSKIKIFSNDFENSLWWLTLSLFCKKWFKLKKLYAFKKTFQFVKTFSNTILRPESKVVNLLLSSKKKPSARNSEKQFINTTKDVIRVLMLTNLSRQLMKASFATIKINFTEI